MMYHHEIKNCIIEYNERRKWNRFTVNTNIFMKIRFIANDFQSRKLTAEICRLKVSSVSGV